MPETNNNDSQGMISEGDYVPLCLRLCGPNCYKWESDGIDGKFRPKFAHKKFLIFTAIIALASLVTALCVRFARLDSQRYVLGIDDQRTFENGHGDLSSIFCSKYDLHQTGSSSSVQEAHLPQQNFNQGLMRAYMLRKSPTQSPFRHRYSRRYQVEISSTSEYMYSYQLSNDDLLYINVICTAGSALTTYVIKEKHFFEWEQDAQRGRYCDSCIYKIYNLQCSATAHELVISKYDSSEYIFVFRDLILFPGTTFTAYINFTLFRKNLVFDDDNVVSSCGNVSDCRLTVPYSADTLLLQMETDSPASSVTLETRCHPKVEIYLAFFVAVPLVLLLVPMALAWSIRKCQEDVLRDTQNADNARSMARLSNGPPPAYANGHPPRTTLTPTRSQSVFTMFGRGTPTPQQRPLIDYDVTSEDGEAGVSRSPPAYGAIQTVSIPRLDPKRENMLEVYASTPPPDYTNTLSGGSHNENTA